MKAAWYEKNGPARDVLTVGDLPEPQAGAGEVVVGVHVSGVNPSDVKSRGGRPLAFPRIVPHSDGAGIIEAVGDGVDPGRIGERVWLWNGQYKRAMGTAAEKIALPAQQAVRLDNGIGFAEAACFGIPALTAMQAIRLGGELAGQTVLVTGAASSVGHYATQMAKARGARVLGTASAARAAHAHEAGCDVVIDYTSENVVDRVLAETGDAGVDVIIDMDLSSTAMLLPAGLLRIRGLHVCYGSNAASVPLAFPAMLWRSPTLKCFLVYDLEEAERQATIADLQALVGAGALRHTVARHFALDDIASAHEAVEAGRLIGNVVVDCI